MPPASYPTPLTTVALKFEKTSVFLPVTSKTTIGELKQGFVEAMAATKSRCSAAADAIQIYRAAHPSAAASSVSRPPGSSHTDPTTSTSPAWIPLPDPLRTLSDLAIVEAQTLGIGFQNEKGSFDPPVVEVWREEEPAE